MLLFTSREPHCSVSKCNAWKCVFLNSVPEDAYKNVVYLLILNLTKIIADTLFHLCCPIYMPNPHEQDLSINMYWMNEWTSEWMKYLPALLSRKNLDLRVHFEVLHVSFSVQGRIACLSHYFQFELYTCYP